MEYAIAGALTLALCLWFVMQAGKAIGERDEQRDERQPEPKPEAWHWPARRD